MKQFIGLFSHEFCMSICRKSLWIVNGIVIGLFLVALLAPDPEDQSMLFSGNSLWQEAGDAVYLFNTILPLVSGILASDRLKRDFQNGIKELQNSTRLPLSIYLLAEYFGVLFASLTPLFISILFLGFYGIQMGNDPIEMITGLLVAFLIISMPPMAFVIAFSLACPIIMPVRVYQILLTGYWFWKNFLNPDFFPSISNTILNSSGIYALHGFFAGIIGRTEDPIHNVSEALLNIFLLYAIGFFVLFIAGIALKSVRIFKFLGIPQNETVF